MIKQDLLKELKSEGFSQPILKAFSKVKREKFVSKEFEQYSYENQPLPIAIGATISQPYTIAFMLNLLELKNNMKILGKQKESKILEGKQEESKILEIGSGSGYVLALINEISKNSKIYGIEIIKELVDKSKKVLKQNNNIYITQGDGSKGLPKKSPFDRILISASANKMPEQLFKQLKNNGILVAPVKNSIYQIKKINNKIQTKEFPGFVFVPLIED